MRRLAWSHPRCAGPLLPGSCRGLHHSQRESDRRGAGPCVDSPGRIPAARCPCFPARAAASTTLSGNRSAAAPFCVDSPVAHPRCAGPLLPGSRRGLHHSQRESERRGAGPLRRLAWSHPRCAGPLLPGSRRGLHHPSAGIGAPRGRPFASTSAWSHPRCRAASRLAPLPFEAALGEPADDTFLEDRDQHRSARWPRSARPR